MKRFIFLFAIAILATNSINAKGVKGMKHSGGGGGKTYESPATTKTKSTGGGGQGNSKTQTQDSTKK